MIIRKIIVGPDYKLGMCYQIGQTLFKAAKISAIKVNKGNYEVWISKPNNETTLYKSFTSTMPVSVEYNIDHFLEE